MRRYNNERQLLWGTAINNLRLDSGAHQLAHDLPGLPLRPGVYWWRVTLFDGEEMLDDWDCIPEFLVATDPVTHWRDEWAGILNIPSRFSVAAVAEEVRS